MAGSNVPRVVRADKRRAPRQRAFLRAKLSHLDGAFSFDGVVTQISTTGARIALKAEVSLPERFRVEIPQRQIDRTARLVSSDSEGAAVAFADDEQATPSDDGGLRARLRVLEAENKMLRATCEALSQQVERAKASY